MLGELVIGGVVRHPGWNLSCTFWPDMTLRVNHDQRQYPVGRVFGLVQQEDHGLEITADIVLSARSLTVLAACEGLGVACVKNGDKMEVAEISVVQYPRTVPIEERQLWVIVKGRLPRVVYERAAWLHTRPGAQDIELFEVGRTFWGDACELQPGKKPVSDRWALKELWK
jgi:hypothetical protein